MHQVKDLASFDRQELSDFLNSFDTVLCDVDGVIWNLRGAIPGSKDAVEELRKLGKKIIFVTNNCIFTIKALHSKLESLGYNVNVDEIINPTVAVIDYLKNVNFQKRIFIFTVQDLKKDLQEAGFEVIEAKDVNMEGKSFQEQLADIQDLDPEVGAVYFDYSINFSYWALQKAVGYLKKPDVLFFASGLNKSIPLSSTVDLIGPGLFLDMIKTMTSREPQLCGKPGPLINKFVTKKITSPPKSIFIGDCMELDIEFANIYGYQSLLVFSGASQRNNLDQCSNVLFTPKYCVENLGMMGKIIKKIS